MIRPASVALALAGLLLPIELLAAAVCGDDAGNPSAVVQAQVDAYNAHDLDAFMSCYADDATTQDLSGAEAPQKGHPALRESYEFLPEMPADFRVEVVQRMVSGPIVVDLERVHGLPGGAPDGIAIYEVRDGKILNLWSAPTQ